MKKSHPKNVTDEDCLQVLCQFFKFNNEIILFKKILPGFSEILFVDGKLK